MIEAAKGGYDIWQGFVMAHDLNSVTPSHRHPRALRAVAAFCRRLARDLFDPYRPERHYMRGPGPKWMAKHQFEAGAR